MVLLVERRRPPPCLHQVLDLISERLDHWRYDVVQTQQPRLDPILDALKKLREEGLTATLVLSAVHHRRILPLMSRPLRMDEMGPGVLS